MHQVSEITVNYFPKFKASERPLIMGAKSAYETLVASWDQGKIQYVEQFKVIFGAALKCNSSSIVLAHNHPSAAMKPSQADISMTRKMAAAVHLLDMPVLDHIIVTAEGYFHLLMKGCFRPF